jgi:hypothetical protein
MEATYNIPVQSIHQTHKYLTKLQKRAARSGAAVVFTFSFDDEVKSSRFDAQTEDGDNIIASYKYRTLTISQDITVHEGWTPIAKLDVIEKQLKAYQTYSDKIESLGDSLWTKHCDHCGHNKIVHTAFVMQNGDKFMKVGKGCMKELAPASAAQIAREFDIYALWSDYLKAMAAPEQGDGSFSRGRGFGGMSVDYVYDKSTLILAMRAALEVTNGWVTSQYSAYERGNSQFVTNKGSRTFDFIQGLLSKEICLLPDAEYVASVNADVEFCLSEYSHLLGDKLEELKIFSTASKSRAIDIFLVKTAQGIIAKVREEEARAKMSGHYFNVGDRVQLEVKQKDYFTFETAYGTCCIQTLVTPDGKLFKYMGSAPIAFENKELFITIKGTVEHQVYKGVNETKLKRITVVKPKLAAA